MSAANKAQHAIAEILRQVFRPKEVITPSAWMEKNIRLDAKTSNISGRYSFGHTPYLRRLADDIDNPRVRKLVVKKSAQVGLTQFANNVLLYYVCNFAFPLLMIMPSQEAARQFCERSLMPSINATPALKPFITGNPDNFRKTEVEFNNCILRVIGAGSPSKLASNPACVCIIDEADKTTDFASQGEAPALELAEDRTISFPNDKKIIVLSTPTIRKTSVVEAEYLKGSQSKYFVACPHCHREQVLEFKAVKWPDTCKDENGEWDLDSVERQAYYECANPDCKAHLTEQDKLSMVRAGQWKDTNPKPFPAEIRSYHISALYSFNISFGALAKQFLLADSDRGKLRNFYNSYLGECFEDFTEEVKTKDVLALVDASPSYSKGELLSKPVLILTGADVQQTHLWFASVAYYYDGTSSLLDYGPLKTFEDLLQQSNKVYYIRNAANPEPYLSYRGVVDIGYAERKQETLDFCLASGNKFFPIQGRSRGQNLMADISRVSVQHKGQTIPGFLVNDETWKAQLLIKCIKYRAGKFYLPTDAKTDNDLITHLTAERLGEDKNGEQKWIITHKDNHIADCLKYILAFRTMFEQLIKSTIEQSKQQPNPAFVPPVKTYKLKPAPVPAYVPSPNDW